LAGPRGAVVVGLNSDESVRRLKGPERPILDEIHRATVLVSIKYVDHVVTFDEDTPIELIRTLSPSVIVKGGDYQAHKVIGHELAYVEIVPLVGEYSTTSIVERIHASR
jgi:D-beta-D-heptose 7-phosphate kinase/D-beta-D-heptose 1-phosphate adenosyltransferase